jgi:hypothetical protein
VVLDVMDLRAGAGLSIAKPASVENPAGKPDATAAGTVSLPATTSGVATAV